MLWLSIPTHAIRLSVVMGRSTPRELMPTRIVSVKSAEYYQTGGAQGTDCDGWDFVQTPDLSSIEEFMAPGHK